MAKVLRPFPGVPDGQTQVRQFTPGDSVTGDLARVAIAEGWAVDDQPAAAVQFEFQAIARVRGRVADLTAAAWRWLQLRAAAIAAVIAARFARGVD